MCMMSPSCSSITRINLIHLLLSTSFLCISLFLVYKCAVSTDGSRLYVTNRSNHKLLTLSVDGTVLSSLEDPALLNPIGVHVSEAGQLLVCGEGSNNLVQVDSERGMVTLASEENGLHYPYSVYYSERTSRLIVAQNSKNILVIKTK
ncbi:hypothetical protein DPMN_088715 [Dreissena polymorpha]|uniref:Uncharacterized protein n=1 Tax=Dreissena polymorpha TaxID=45954 RepID=A0A9D4KVE7_DREPO|nr:hypothetical protein DPMN_088715 [Dreissena polymorpha]